MPSIYPEAFGRVALEALSVGTPVIVTNTGALPEIVENKKTGRVVDTSPKDLEEGILDVLKNEETYVNNIKKEYKNLKEKFYNKPLAQHISLYKSIL
jgi:glycosyltransferase involved in cell wall biosynthesis